MASLFSSPHPMVPLATFNVSDGSTALEVVPSPSLLASPPPGLTSPPMRLLDAEFEPTDAWLEPISSMSPRKEAEATFTTMPRYSLFPTQDPECDAPSRFLFSGGVSDSTATTAAMPPGSGEAGSLDGAPDFLGRLHHMKNLFRLSATEEPVSMMIHRVGPLLILDDGPQGWSRGEAGHSQPLPPPWVEPPGLEGTHEVEPQLMLAALDASLKNILMGSSGVEAEQDRLTNIDFDVPSIDMPSQAIPPELRHRLCVKNTFVDVVAENEQDLDEFARAQSAPDRLQGRIAAVASPVTPPGSGTQDNEGSAWNLPLTPVVQSLQQQMATTEKIALARDAGSWSLIPYLPEPNAPLQSNSTADSSPKASPSHGSRQWDLLQIASQQKLPAGCRTLEAMRALYAGIPPQPSRQGRAMEWRCGPYKILLGCDLVVFRTDDQLDVSKFASFKMLPPGASSEPTREERLDVYLENLMCNINTAVWGSDQQGQRTWRVFDTQDLPAARNDGQDEGYFDAESVVDQGQRLLHFLRQQCRREGGTYWLFREQNAKHAELFDLRSFSEANHDADRDSQSYNRAFQTTESLVLPIASLCVHLAKATPNPADQRALFQKAFSLLEPVKEDHPGLYASVALQLACSYMRASQLAIPDSATGSSRVSSEPPAAARLAVALRYLEGLLRLLTSIDETVEDQMCDVVLRAELLLQAHVAYAECIVKLVREAFVPTYTAWLTDVQRSIQETKDEHGCSPSTLIAEMKRLSAGFLIWRIFWLVRAQKALDFVPREKRETECWVLERDLHETMGDALYGLSRYPSDDADSLLAGKMGTSEGICELVSDGLKSWGARGGTSCLKGASTAQRSQQSVPRNNGKKKSRRLTSPRTPEGPEKSESRPHDVTAMFLSQLNPLARDFYDDVICDDQLVNEKLRPALWSEGVAFKTSLALFEKAAGRLRKKSAQGEEDDNRRRRSIDDQATLKIARKLAHLYNEEARSLLASAASGGATEGVEELLSQAYEWMLLSGDQSNASRVLLNLNELHARKAEALAVAKGDDGEPLPLTESQYRLWLRAIECCEEAASLSENTLGRAEGAFAHLRVGAHLSTRVPCQMYLVDAARREDTLAELADRHFSKALRGFDEIKDEREVAVCHFHMADLMLQELRVPNAPPLSKARLISALRHARRSAEYWERVGALLYAKDYISAHLRISRLLENQPRGSAITEALEHLGAAEERILTLAREADTSKRPGDSSAMKENNELFTRSSGKLVAVTAFRREMSRVCQAGIRQGEDIERLKKVYRLVLKNEPVHISSTTSAIPPASV